METRENGRCPYLVTTGWRRTLVTLAPLSPDVGDACGVANAAMMNEGAQ